MKYIDKALIYLWCSLAIYALRFQSHSSPWLEFALRSTLYASAYLLPSICLLYNGSKQRCQHQPASARSLRSTTPANAIGDATNCSQQPSSVGSVSTTYVQSAPSYESCEHYARRSNPAAQHGSKQSQLLLPPEVSLREWKSASTRTDDNLTEEDSVVSRHTLDASSYPVVLPSGTTAKDSTPGPHLSPSSSRHTSSFAASVSELANEQPRSTDEGWSHNLTCADVCSGTPATLFLDGSAGSVQSSNHTQATPVLQSSTMLPHCSSTSSLYTADVAHCLAPAAAAAAEPAVQGSNEPVLHQVVSCSTNHSMNTGALTRRAECNGDRKASAACTAYSEGDPATPSQSRQMPLPVVEQQAAYEAASIITTAATQQQKPAPAASLLHTAAVSEGCSILSSSSSSAAAAVVAAPVVVASCSAVLQDGHDVQYSHHWQGSHELQDGHDVQDSHHLQDSHSLQDSHNLQNRHALQGSRHLQDSCHLQDTCHLQGSHEPQDSHHLQDGHQSQYFPYHCVPSVSAAAAAVGQADAASLTAAALAPSAFDLSVITARKAHLEAQQQQQQQQPDEDAGSTASSVASIEQPSTPVFLSTSSRYIRSFSRATSSLTTGLSCNLSSSGSTAAAAVIPPPLPSPAESPLARRLTNDRDELGFPTSPGLVELLQQREQRMSHSTCQDPEQQQQQQLAPWAGMQLRSVVRRRWSGELKRTRVRGEITRSQSCLSGGSSSSKQDSRPHCCSSNGNGNSWRDLQQCQGMEMQGMACDDCSGNCSSCSSSDESLCSTRVAGDVVTVNEQAQSSRPYQQLLALYEGVCA